MKSLNLEDDIKHRKLSSNASEIHRIMSSLCPSVNQDELGGRLKAFSRLISLGKFNLNNRDYLEEIKQLSNISSRSGRKKFLDTLQELNLIDKKENKIIATKKGKLIWNTLLEFTENNKEIKSNKLISHYKHHLVRIETDGLNYCNVTVNWCLFNNNEEPIKSMVVDANSDAPNYTFKLDDLSSNIKNYEIIENHPNHKIFEIFFKNELNKNEYIDLYYSYNWPGFFLNSWKVWDYSVSTKEYPIANFIAVFRLDETHNIKEDSFSLDKTELLKDSKVIGELQTFEPMILSVNNGKEIIWRMNNVPSKVKFQFSWEHN